MRRQVLRVDVCEMCALWLAGVGQVGADCRARAGAVGQCTPVKGWMEVGTAGPVGIMPFELGRRNRRLRGLRSCRRSLLAPAMSPQLCRRARVAVVVRRGGQARSWAHGHVCRWQSAEGIGSVWRAGWRDGSPTQAS
ncbi:hypothetical protein F5883DRAFT_667320 [Diaporthe sp. PMI_573]|nr:hypothetical protein F5883DRAFT_667320 [Diaporthaceae sp. PMI_573]